MNVHATRAACALASVLLFVGCAKSGDKAGDTAAAKSEKADGKAKASDIGGTGNTPTSVTRGQTPKKFWLTSPYAPVGRRDWSNVGKGKWEERRADGTVVKYNEVGPYDTGGYHGTIVRSEDKSEDILIPDGGVDEWVRFRAASGGRNWGLVGQIEGVD